MNDLKFVFQDYINLHEICSIWGMLVGVGGRIDMYVHDKGRLKVSMQCQ